MVSMVRFLELLIFSITLGFGMTTIPLVFITKFSKKPIFSKKVLQLSIPLTFVSGMLFWVTKLIDPINRVTPGWGWDANWLSIFIKVLLFVEMGLGIIPVIFLLKKWRPKAYIFSFVAISQLLGGYSMFILSYLPWIELPYRNLAPLLNHVITIIPFTLSIGIYIALMVLLFLANHLSKKY